MEKLCLNGNTNITKARVNKLNLYFYKAYQDHFQTLLDWTSKRMPIANGIVQLNFIHHSPQFFV